MQKLPIGAQDFLKIREDGYCYVDKTADIYNLISNAGKVAFLSRPRRFGKSLLCSTLAAIFEGKRELFTGLAIDNLDWDWTARPVVRIDLNSGDFTLGREALEPTIMHSLETCAKKYDIELTGESISTIFASLLRDLSDDYGSRVVVIIDEYDKPLLTTLGLPEVHDEIRRALKAFYGVLKSSDQYLHFAFITGVTKFSQVSIFSDLNNLDDVSLKPQYASICGITQDELENNFTQEIALCAEAQELPTVEYLDKVRRFYDGFRFTRSPITVYNPFGMFKHFTNDGMFEAYWFDTATPTFLIDLIKAEKIDILSLEDEVLAGQSFANYTSNTIAAIPVLYQSGYLTITDYNKKRNTYTLNYPNEDVRAAFSQSLTAGIVNVPERDIQAFVVKLPTYLDQGEVDNAMDVMTSFLAGVPYDIQIPQEHYYQTVFHLIFRMLGLYVRSEVRIAAGRIDSLIETNEYVYCFEFKLKTKNQNVKAVEALAQIDDKEYLTPWQGSGKQLVKVGVVFDFEKRNIAEWSME